MKEIDWREYWDRDYPDFEASEDRRIERVGEYNLEIRGDVLVRIDNGYSDGKKG